MHVSHFDRLQDLEHPGTLLFCLFAAERALSRLRTGIGEAQTLRTSAVHWITVFPHSSSCIANLDPERCLSSC